MGKTNSTFVRPLWMASLFSLAMFLTPSSIFAQDQNGGGCGCQDNVLVTLASDGNNDDCTFELRVNNVRAGTSCDNSNAYVVVNDGIGTDNTIDKPGTFTYGIFKRNPLGDDDETLLCWGTVTAEDKSAPVYQDNLQDYTFMCTNVDDILNNSGSRSNNNRCYNLGTASFTDACEGSVGAKWYDAIEYEPCAEPGGLYATIYRTWIATDSYGNESDAYIQRIFLTRPDVGDIRFYNPASGGFWQTDPVDDVVNTCAATGDEDFDYSVPHVRDDWKSQCAGYSIYVPLTDVCGYGVSDDGVKFDVGCNGAYKWERTIKIFDWCYNEEPTGDRIVAEYSYVVKVGDFQAPMFDYPAYDAKNDINYPEEMADEIEEALDNDWFEGAPVINTGPFDCTASIFTSVSSLNSLFDDGDSKPTIGDNCPDNLDISVTFYSFVENQVYGIPTGGWDWVRSNFTMRNGMATGIPCGVHVMVIQATDNCYNTNVGYLPFIVRDKVAPVMKCDDQLNVTLTNGDPKLSGGDDSYSAYARVDAADVDEGSDDNCSDVTLTVRRSVAPADYANQSFWIERGFDVSGRFGRPDGVVDEYDGWEYDATRDVWFTAYRDFVEFFCFDAGETRIIELRGEDTPKTIYGPNLDGDRPDNDDSDDGTIDLGEGYTNSNTCWLEILIEDGSNIWITPMDDMFVSCEDADLEIIDDGIAAGGFPVTFDPEVEVPELAAAVIGAYGAPELIGTLCRGYEWTIDIYDNRDHCGFNYFYIEYTLTTSGKNPVSLTEYKYVFVEAVHNYWIKFPADAYASCEAADEGDLETSAPEDNACDLLAVSHTDEQFVATTDTSCYKIFRTWKVINWCEYDGETLPVIVGRDWDGWNGEDFDLGSSASVRYHENVVHRGTGGDDDSVDGDNKPGDEDLYVIVDRSDDGYSPDVVYYDRDSNPFNTSPNDPDTRFTAEGYWWKVVAGGGFFNEYTNDFGRVSEPSENYFSGGMLMDINRFNGSRIFVQEGTAWGDANDPDSDVQGTPAQDDEDYRYGSFGFWQYTQHVVVYDDSTPEAVIASTDAGSISNFDCSAETTFTVTVSDACSVSDVAVVVSVNGTEETAVRTDVDGNAVFTVSKRRTLGTYKIEARITDGCGNFTTESDEFEVFDDKAPAPICHDGIVVELMPVEGGGGAMAVWASDFIASPIGDCTGQDAAETSVGNGISQPIVVEAAYSIYFEDSTDVDGDFYSSPITGDGASGITLTCDHLAGLTENTVMVRVYAEDNSGNYDYCSTFVRVQDNMGACSAAPGTGEIAGGIATETGANVEGVEVQLSGERSMMYMTNTNGAFIFANLAEGHDYTVTPQLDQNHLNGVSTFDLVLISKHILGQSLDSPYKVIAADVNNSGKVTVKDLIDLRKLILNIDTEFANNTSWRFVDAGYSFNNPASPLAEAWPEIKNFNNLDANASAAFVGMKVGDVNNSATVEARSATGTLAINVSETSLIAGNEYTVTFAADMADVSGYQFTLDVNKAGAEIVDLVYGAATAEHFGVFTKEGVITTSYNGEATGELFSLVIRATADVNLSDVLTINSRYTNAEAYTTSDDQLNVALNFTGTTAAAAEFALFQNTPNPFQGETVIGFNLPTSAEATVTIQDVAGRTVKMIEGDFVKGYNQVSLKSNDLPSAGVFFYTLTAGDFSATKKLMIIDEVNR